MNQAEKDRWWQLTTAALNKRDPRVHTAILVALILRHGKLEPCPAGHTHVIERISLEELLHTVKDYAFSVRCPEYGIVEVQAVEKGELNEQQQPPGYLT